MSIKQPAPYYEIMEIKAVVRDSGNILDVTHKFGWVNEWDDEFHKGTYDPGMGSPKTYILYRYNSG